MGDPRAVAGPPPGNVVVPDPVVAVAGGRATHVVWQNALGGLTFEVGEGDCRLFVKWAPMMSGVDLAVEIERLRWARQFVTVPHVVDVGRDANGSWMVTEALPGEHAVSDRWRADPLTAVTAIGRGLRALHDALPVDACPYSWSVSDRGGASTEAPSIDRLVVCHGDACAPNTLIGDDDAWTGHVDLGALGVADRWADLAVATWSTVWNYGPGWEEPLLDAYGVALDPVRTDFYRHLWDPANWPARRAYDDNHGERLEPEDHRRVPGQRWQGRRPIRRRAAVDPAHEGRQERRST